MIGNSIFIIGHNCNREVKTAERLRDFLCPLNMNIYLSQSLPGTSQLEYLEDGIEGSRFLILLISSKFLANEYRDIKKLIEHSGKIIIPVIIEDCIWEKEFEGKIIIEYKKSSIASANKAISNAIEAYASKETTLVSAGSGVGENIINSRPNLVCNDIWYFTVKGNSMYPDHFDEDRIRAKHIHCNSFEHSLDKLIKKNQDYIIDVKDEGLFLKRIEIDIENNKFTLKSLNPEVGDKIIYGFENINSIWEKIELISRKYYN